MLRGDPVRGDCCAGRRMDGALGIIGVFLLKPYNPVIVYRGDKRQRGVSRPPFALPKLKEPLEPQKSHTVPTRSVKHTGDLTNKPLICHILTEGQTENENL